jgi:hypothetical protein
MPPPRSVLLDRQQAFGYTQEDLRFFLKPMALSAEDTVGAMGRDTPLAALSRAVCGTRGRVLIVNLPGSPKGAVESLDAIVELVPHVLELLRGHTEHAAAHGE